MLLPIVLMLLRAFGELFLPVGSGARAALDLAGTPIVALLAGVIVAMFTLGLASGLDHSQLTESLGRALPPIAAILLIVGAGGGFKQTLVDAGVGTMIGRAAQGIAVSPLILGWLVAVGIRLADRIRHRGYHYRCRYRLAVGRRDGARGRWRCWSSQSARDRCSFRM